FGGGSRLDGAFGPDARTPNEDREVVRQEPTPFVVPSTAEAPDEIFAREPSAGRRDLDRVRHYRTAPVAERERSAIGERLHVGQIVREHDRAAQVHLDARAVVVPAHLPAAVRID